jgi:hypothetical protein
MPATARKKSPAVPPANQGAPAVTQEAPPDPREEARRALEAALAAPFDRAEVKWKPQVVKDNRAVVIAFVDARTIQDRLDDVLGVMGWQDSYECLPDGAVVCRLKIRLGGEWIAKVDVGGQSEQPDEGDRRKAAFSDSLKRAAVKFGIGRYLYRLEHQWVDYDPRTKRLVGTPRLPDWALPMTAGAAPPAPAGPVAGPKLAETPPPRKKRELPGDGAELVRRLIEKSARLAAEGLCPPLALLVRVRAAGRESFGPDLSRWQGPGIELAIAETRAFVANLKKAPPATFMEEWKPAARTGQHHHEWLADLLARKGQQWMDFAPVAGFVGKKHCESLCVAEWMQVVRALLALPDAPKAG